MVRASYRHEMRSAATFPLASSLAEGAFAGVIATKAFGASAVLLAVITAAPMFGNVMALLWAEAARGRRKVPMVNLLQTGVVILIASVALCGLLPQAWAGWLFALQVVGVRVLASGIVTIRSTIWRANYPRHIRGHVTSRISAVGTFVLALTTFIGAKLLDADPWAFVYLYPTAALAGVVGIVQFSKLRVRREPLLLREEQMLSAPVPDDLSLTDESNVLNYQPDGREPESRERGSQEGGGPEQDGAQGGAGRIKRLGLVGLVRQAYQVLRDDPDFRTYQRWQMISGFSFMMMAPSVVFMVSREMTDPKTQYVLATLVVQIIPLVTALIATPLWAPLFDRVHVTRFRVVQGYNSILSMAVVFTGAIAGAAWGDPPAALGIVALGLVLVGISNAGGNLVWNLGHNEYAPPEKSSLYMGVHVMLTGLRGCLAPFLGTFLYTSVMGRWVFAASTLLMMTAVAGFMGMNRAYRAKQAGMQATSA